VIEAELHPAVVSQFLSGRRPAGVALGQQPDDLIIAEQSSEVGLLQVSLRQGPADQLVLVVWTDPPVTGAALLALGSRSYYQPLDANGCAVFTDLSRLLRGAERPAIKLTIHPPA
jgi:hypothetical protein